MYKFALKNVRYLKEKIFGEILERGCIYINFGLFLQICVSVSIPPLIVSTPFLRGTKMQCITIPFGKRVKVSVPIECESGFSISGVALSAESPIPEKGRVVVYATPIDINGNELNKIAIAPLTIGKSESVQVDLMLAPGNQIIFSTSGDKIDVAVTGYVDDFDDVKQEVI